MYPYPQQMPDQRQLRYMPTNQPQPVNMQYPQNAYPQRLMVSNQWHPQNPVSPNKMHNMGDYGQRHQNYGYNQPVPQNYSQIPHPNYSQVNNFPNNTNPISIHSTQNLHPQNQPFYQNNYHNLHQQQ